jgi:hypothetical protein
VAATGTLYSGTGIVADDVVEVEGLGFTFVSALTEDTPEADPVPNEVLVGADDSESLDNLIAAINGDAGEGTLYSTGTVSLANAVASAGAEDTLVLTASAPGIKGNDITTGSSISDGGWGASTLVGGVDATTGSEGDQLYDDDYVYLALSDILKTSSSGWNKTAHSTL